jgi:hypothetical protein
MTNIEELKKKFIVTDELMKTRLEAVVEKALEFCIIDQKGSVHITKRGLSTRSRVMLVLAARAIASSLGSDIPADVPSVEISKFLGLPRNQVRARGNELIKANMAESAEAGSYRAVSARIEEFLDSLSQAK